MARADVGGADEGEAGLRASPGSRSRPDDETDLNRSEFMEEWI